MKKEFVLLALFALLTQYAYAQGEPSPPRSDVKSNPHHNSQQSGVDQQSGDQTQSSEEDNKLKHK